MSLSIGWRDVGDSALNSVKFLALGATALLAGKASEYIIPKVFDYFNIRRHGGPVVNNTAFEMDRALLNAQIIKVCTAVLIAAVPPLLPMQFKPFTSQQTLQFMALDALIYMAAKGALGPDNAVIAKRIGLCLLSGTLMGAASASLGGGSKLMASGVIAASFLNANLLIVSHPFIQRINNITDAVTGMR